jgi:exopolysaccharide biosynthesis predicted pyruvyltransferase EpsI
MVRERNSLDWARERLQVPVALCPDLAFALGPLDRDPAACELLWLLRSDREGRGQTPPEPGPGEERTDWPRRALRRPRGGGLRPWLAANRRLGAWMSTDGRLAAMLWRASAATFAPIARRRLRAGTRLLSRGRVVITDRLHGHVLALLLGIPHVVLDNIYGKCRAVWETWTADFALVRWADGPDVAREIARDLLRDLEEVAP